MKRRAPISVDELVQIQKQKNDEKKKPRFLSKKARELIQLKEPTVSATNNIKVKATPVLQNGLRSLNDEPKIVKKEEQKTRPTTTSQFNFEWKTSDDTFDESDDLYRKSTNVDAAQGGGLEARLRRQKELEKSLNSKRQDKRVWDEKGWWEKPRDKMSARDWRILKEEFEIATKGANIPNPLRNWSESKIPKRILDIIDLVGYKEPSKIQRAAIPIALEGRDVMGVAETGSGKTAAFVIPLLSYIMDLPAMTAAARADGPYAIVLAPTRELAQQIRDEANKFCEPIGFKCISIVGGHNVEAQAHDLDMGAEIIVATPGRLIDCLERRILVLSQCCYVVMDEADKMITMGFEEQVNSILSFLPVTNLKPANGLVSESLEVMDARKKYRQTMMFTATLPPTVEKLAANYLRNPGMVTIGKVSSAAAETVEQRVEFVPRDENLRTSRLIQILRSRAFAPPIMVFVKYQKMCETVAASLNQEGFKAVTFHGRHDQTVRERALHDLRSGSAEVLVATDIASRGIDIPDVSLVVNYQMSKDIESYTHRIGRTGRAGKKGVAITFLADEDEKIFSDLYTKMSQSSISTIPDRLRKFVTSHKRDTRIKD